MVELFKSKVRSVGTSLGILLPSEIVRKENIKKGEEIEVSILKRNLRLIKSSFGIDKGTKKFEREHGDRF